MNLITKYGTVYEIDGIGYLSHIYAPSEEQAEEYANMRGLNEIIDGEIEENEERSYEHPLDLFDSGSYLECAHACMQLFNILGDAERSQKELRDDGLLHELLHLEIGVELCHNNTEERLRDKIFNLQKEVPGYLP